MLTSFIDLTCTFLLVFGYLLVQDFVLTNAFALALALFARNAGSASAIMGSVQCVAGALVSAMVSYFHNSTAIPMPGVIASCTIISLMSLLIDRVMLKKKWQRSHRNRLSHLSPNTMC
jgi:MFS transporter, DHA1 family, multidrug resistance protein